MRLLAAIIFICSFSTPAVAATVQPPVDATVTDPFRAPADKYAAGNRGWEYSIDGEQSVRAPVAGTVTFSGQVGRVLNVVITGDDGLRFTLSKLRSINPAISKGVTVSAGQPVGVAAGELFFGVRCGDQYIDPAQLFASPVHLIPDDVVSSNYHGVVITAHNEGSGSCQPVTAAQEQWLRAVPVTAAAVPVPAPAHDIAVQKKPSSNGQLAAVGGIALGALVLRRSRISRA